MKKKNIRQFILFMILMVLVSMNILSCGKNTSGKVEEDSQTEYTGEDIAEHSNLFLILENNTIEELLTLYSFDTELEHHYAYGFSTQFKDKYGKYSSAAEFTPGRVVTIGERDKEGCLTEIQLSDEVWEYEKVRRYSVDELEGIFTIADTKYSIRDKVHLFSNGARIGFSELSEDDILTVIGKEKKILSVVVTTGHGTLALRNTELFNNSFLQLNNDIFVLISDAMELELPEGIYTLKVANDGWGGTTEIHIHRGEMTEIDLDTLKGEGKKKGLVTFQIDVEEVQVYIDDEQIDHTQPVELTYGTHVLEIKASGYETWKKRLSVNSEEAVISIELTETGEAAEEETEETSEEETEETEEASEETEEELEEETQETTQSEEQT